MTEMTQITFFPKVSLTCVFSKSLGKYVISVISVISSKKGAQDDNL